MALHKPVEKVALSMVPSRSVVPHHENASQSEPESLSRTDRFFQQLIQNNPYLSVYAYLFSDQPLVRQFYTNRKEKDAFPHFFQHVIETPEYSFRGKEDAVIEYQELIAQLPEILRPKWDKVIHFRQDFYRKTIEAEPELAKDLQVYKQLLEIFLLPEGEEEKPHFKKQSFSAANALAENATKQKFPGVSSRVDDQGYYPAKFFQLRRLARELNQEIPIREAMAAENRDELIRNIIQELMKSLFQNYLKENAGNFSFEDGDNFQTKEAFLDQLARVEISVGPGGFILKDGENILTVFGKRYLPVLGGFVIHPVDKFYGFNSENPVPQNPNVRPEQNGLAIRNRIYRELLDDLEWLRGNIHRKEQVREAVQYHLWVADEYFPTTFEHDQKNVGELADPYFIWKYVPELAYWALYTFGPEYYYQRNTIGVERKVPLLNELLEAQPGEHEATEQQESFSASRPALYLGWRALEVVNTPEKEIKERAGIRHFTLEGEKGQLKSIQSLVVNDTLPKEVHHFQAYFPSERAEGSIRQVNEEALGLDEKGRTALPLPENAKLEQLRIILNGKEIPATDYKLEYDRRAGHYRLEIPGGRTDQGIYFEAYVQIVPEKESPLEKIIPPEQLDLLIRELQKAKLHFIAESFALLKKRGSVTIEQIWEVCKLVAKYSYNEQAVELPENATPSQIFSALRKLGKSTIPGMKWLRLLGKEKLPVQCNGAAALAQAVTQLVCPDWQVGIETCYLTQGVQIATSRLRDKDATLSVTSNLYHVRLIVDPYQDTRGQLHRSDTTPSDTGFTTIPKELVKHIARIFGYKEQVETADFEQRLSVASVPEEAQPSAESLTKRLSIQEVHQRLVGLENELSNFILQIVPQERQVGKMLQQRQDVMFILEREVLLPFIAVTPNENAFKIDEYSQLQVKIKKVIQELNNLFTARVQLETDKRMSGLKNVRFADLNDQFYTQGLLFDAYPEYTVHNLTNLVRIANDIQRLMP